MRTKLSSILVYGFATVIGVSSAVAQSPADEGHSIPIIESASVPFYPMIARAARVQGTVVLEISTDGKEVSKVVIKSGPPMLVSAAKENISSWHFRSHKPTTFDTTFQFHFVEPATCEYGNASLILKLPTLADVTVNSIQTCDPATTTRRILKK